MERVRGRSGNPEEKTLDMADAERERFMQARYGSETGNQGREAAAAGGEGVFYKEETRRIALFSRPPREGFGDTARLRRRPLTCDRSRWRESGQLEKGTYPDRWVSGNLNGRRP